MRDYTALITSQHNDKPKFLAMVETATVPFGEVSDFLGTLPHVFDLDYAVGVQLDAVGEWVGISRYVEIPLEGVYFSLDVAGLGLDEGYLQGKYDPDTGPVRLDDEMYRMVIRAKIGANHWDGTIDGLLAIYAKVFSGTGTTVFVEDHQDMTMSICFIGAEPTPIMLSLVKGGYLSVKPGGVSITGYYRPSEDYGGPYFGLDATGDYIDGLDAGYLAAEI